MPVLFTTRIMTASQGLHKKVEETLKQPIAHKTVNYMNFLCSLALTSACSLQEMHP